MKLLDISLPPTLFGGQAKADAEEWKPEDDLKTKEGRDILGHAYYCKLSQCDYGALCHDAKGKVRDFTAHITKGCPKGPVTLTLTLTLVTAKGCPKGPRKCGSCKVWQFLQSVEKPTLKQDGDSLSNLVNGTSCVERQDVLALLNQQDEGNLS